jgi:pimeloyl-ACP methyl ester carboxylesterase
LATALENGEGITPLLAALAPEGEALPPEQVTMINRMLLATNDALALAAVARSMGALAVDGAAIDRIEVPILAVVGSKDPLRAGVEMLAARKPDVEVHIIEGADHMTAIQSPELAEAIREFVAKACACA